MPWLIIFKLIPCFVTTLSLERELWMQTNILLVIYTVLVYHKIVCGGMFYANRMRKKLLDNNENPHSISISYSLLFQNAIKNLSFILFNLQ